MFDFGKLSRAQWPAQVIGAGYARQNLAPPDSLETDRDGEKR